MIADGRVTLPSWVKVYQAWVRAKKGKYLQSFLNVVLKGKLKRRLKHGLHMDLLAISKEAMKENLRRFAFFYSIHTSSSLCTSELLPIGSG